MATEQEQTELKKYIIKQLYLISLIIYVVTGLYQILAFVNWVFNFHIEYIVTHSQYLFFINADILYVNNITVIYCTSAGFAAYWVNKFYNSFFLVTFTIILFIAEIIISVKLEINPEILISTVFIWLPIVIISVLISCIADNLFLQYRILL